MMNSALLAEWTVKFKDIQILEKWKYIILAKYTSSSAKISPFWKVILKDRDLIELGFNKHVGSGTSVLF
jgi:hypothetical protein